jgi:ATP-binding cassette subfamily B protein
MAGGFTDTGPVSYWRLLRWSLIIVGGAPYLFAASLAMGLAPVVLVQYSVWLLAKITSALGGATPVGEDILSLVVRYAAVVLLVIVTQYYGRVLTIRSNGVMLQRLQQRLHDQLLRMPAAYHDTHKLGETSTIVLQDAAGCQPMLRELIASPVTQGVGLISALIFLWRSLQTLHDVPMSAELALLLALLIIPPLGWRLSSRLRFAYDAMRVAQSKLANEFNNSAEAPLEVRLLGAERQRSRTFGATLAELTRLRTQAATRTELANQFQNSVPSLLQLGFLAYAAILAARAGATAAGSILSIYYFVPKVIEPIDQIVRFFGGMQMMWVQAARLGAVLDAPIPPPPVSAVGTRIVTTPDISLDQVDFTYAGAPAPVLRGLTHVFPAGQISAIVGRSGSGKSSLFGLIDGLRTPDRGTVSIGGLPIAELGESGLRATVAVVSQSPLFIADTVRANFQLARADATDADIEAAARAAGLWPALVKLGGEHPLDVEVPRTTGQGLSGGERRLLAVARVLLCQPRVLLLDEPTTGVDLVSIGILLDALRSACKGMTVLMVEHNLDFVRSLADQVCCLQDGRFTDVGSPEALAARPSLFQELLAARERLISTAGMEVQSVRLPSVAGGLPKQDPWAVPPEGGKLLPGELPIGTMAPATQAAKAMT